MKKRFRRLFVLSSLTVLVTVSFSQLLAQPGRRGPARKFFRPGFSQPHFFPFPGFFPRIRRSRHYSYFSLLDTRRTLPYRNYGSAYHRAHAGYGPGGPRYVGPSSSTYYLSSPRASYYPSEYRPGSDSVVRANFSHLIFNVVPGTALIYLDDKLIGSARSFNSEREKYEVLDGEYVLRIEHPGYETFKSVLKIVPDQTIHLDIHLPELTPR